MMGNKAIRSRLRVAVADSHQMFRRELRKIIEELPDMAVVGEAADAGGLFGLLDDGNIDLLILDVTLPQARAMETLAIIAKEYPDVKVLLMVMGEEREYQDRALAAGAYGVLLKQDAATECPRAVKRIRLGKVYFPRQSDAEKPGREIRPGHRDLLSILNICF